MSLFVFADGLVNYERNHSDGDEREIGISNRDGEERIRLARAWITEKITDAQTQDQIAHSHNIGEDCALDSNGLDSCQGQPSLAAILDVSGFVWSVRVFTSRV